MSPSDSQPTIPPPGPARPTLLKPPATIISPPSPIDPTHYHPTFSSPLTPSTPEFDSNDEAIAYDSPTSENENEDSGPSSRPRGPSDQLGKAPIAATQMSASPTREPSLLQPHSPSLSGTSSPPTRTPGSPRAPSPSSPHYHPKPSHHRRTSSTHRVRETTHGHQRSTEDGERMVNQYRIGKSLGSGAYARVELGVDVGTGKEYAIKEFSKSRLHFQAIQEKHRQSTRSRGKRPPRPPQQTGEEGKRKAEDAGHGEDADQPRGSGPWGNAGTDTIEEDPLGLIRREIAIMKKLDHPNIVHLYEAISVPNADALFLVLEYLPGGTLMEVKMGKAAAEAKPPFELDQTREYFRQLCLGLEYLHANQVVHRDVKPDNVLLSADRQVVKLCDFGVSELFVAQGDDRIKKSGGSPAFLSPESFASHSTELHGTAVDIWALGVTLYCMLTGTLPFNFENPIELFEVVRTQDPSMKDSWDDDLRNLITGMLQKDPARRTTMATIREQPWVTEKGEHEMIPTEDNLFYIGKHVEEPTQDELSSAIGSLRSVFTVVRAVQKMRRLQLNRRSISGHSQSASNTPNSSSLALPPSSPGTSTDPSVFGSMDSYASHPATGSDTTMATDNDDKWQAIGGDATLSPTSMEGDPDDDSPATQRAKSGEKEKNPFDDLKPIETSLGAPSKEGDNEVVAIFDSPTSDTPTPVDSSLQRK